MKLFFPEITFSAAHYIPGHEKCSGIHGHTYFVRNLEIEVADIGESGMSIDFGIIKTYFKEQWDHKFIIPKKDKDYWLHIYEHTGHSLLDNRKIVKYTTAEWMALKIQQDLELDLDLPQGSVHLELWEGPHQAVIV